MDSDTYQNTIVVIGRDVVPEVTAGDVKVRSGKDVRIKVGETATIMNGFEVEKGGTLTIEH